MGGLINPPSPPSPKPAPAPVATATKSAAQAERKRRLEALARQRAGRAGTIVTSPRGVLIPSDWAPERKSLLGE